MTPRERILAVLQKREPDRVPRFEIWIDALHNELGCADPVGIYAHLGQDCVMMPTQLPRKSNAWKTGVDEFGCVWQSGKYSGGVVDTPSALEQFSPHDSYTDAFFDPSSIELVRKKFPDHCLIWGTHIGPFTATYMAMGFTRFFTTFYDHPGFIRLILERRTQWCIAMYRKAQSLGADVLVLGDDAGTSQGPMLSPSMWREFILPYHTEIVNALGIPVIWHSDGDITSLLRMAVEAGFVGIHGLDPIARVSLIDVKGEFGRDLALIGNVDVRVLFDDDIHAVRSEVDRCFKHGALGGGYMFASCNSISEGMNPDAVAEMFAYSGLLCREAPYF